MRRQNGNSFNSCTDQVSVQAKYIQEVALWNLSYIHVATHPLRHRMN